ncbi:putative DHHC palmitoyltransferase [Trypanosoma vivax]|uniref:Palmitoyltransferase n=1 Tax=Trypanosoma vivax (strain Y486) TaxID=1055687 RepID=G0UAV8_TRYVY|nr:putative zinc-binding protein [Trypanosoma vivax]KAH8611665.1 putative DHHC palmitoyltransferase [Trypanosoma vivax]CCC52945.1 putative zinc-binding protein [Trypanosoma vivax Y486]
MTESISCHKTKQRSWLSCRAVGFGVTLSFLLTVFVIFLTNLHLVVLRQNTTVLDILLSVLFMLFTAISLLSICLTVFVNPGKTHDWVAAPIVDSFVSDLLTEVIKLERGECFAEMDGGGLGITGLVGADSIDHSEGSRLNVVAYRPEEANESERVTRVPLLSDGHGKHDQLTCSALAGYVKEWELFNGEVLHLKGVFQAARDALAALNATEEFFTQEMHFLLDGVRRCRFCHLYKFDNIHHCSTCGMCIHCMDHHCPWIGQCVGSGNHKYFLIFVGYFIAAVVTAVVHALIDIKLGRLVLTGNGASLAFQSCIVLSCIVVLFLLPLLINDLCVVAKGESTLRKMQRNRSDLRNDVNRKEYVPLSGGGSVISGNGDSSGSTMDNLRQIFGEESIFPSWFIPTRPLRSPRDQQEAEFWKNVRCTVIQKLCVAASDEGARDGDTNET